MNTKTVRELRSIAKDSLGCFTIRTSNRRNADATAEE